MSVNKNFIWIALLGIMFLMPYILSLYLVHILIIIFIFIILASGLNLLFGYIGLPYCCHAAFYGIGAYASALLSLRLGFSFWLALPIAGITAALFSALIIPFFRRKGHFFAVITLAVQILISLIFEVWIDLTRGPMGISAIPRPFNFLSEFYHFTLMVTLLVLFCIQVIVHSPIGKIFVAIRENEELAESVGIHCMKYKAFALMVSSFFAGIAGSIYAHYTTFISPESFSIIVAFEIFTMAAIGGSGTLGGPIIGAVVLTALPQYLHVISQYRWLVYGFILGVVIVFEPKGMMEIIKKIMYRVGV